MLCCYLLTLVTLLANGQAYHFSQGWLPGRKRSPPAYDNVAQVSPLARLLQAEYNRRPGSVFTQSSYDSQPRPPRPPFTVVPNPEQHRTRFLRLVTALVVM